MPQSIEYVDNKTDLWGMKVQSFESLLSCLYRRGVVDRLEVVKRDEPADSVEMSILLCRGLDALIDPINMFKLHNEGLYPIGHECRYSLISRIDVSRVDIEAGLRRID